MTKKKNKDSLKEAFLRWERGEVDLLENIQETEPVEPRFLGDKRIENWDQTPIETVEETEIRSFGRLYQVLSVVVCLILSGILLYTSAHMPPFGSADVPTSNEVAQRYIEKGVEETGAVNFVAGMILDYRAFDTLGESHVLFTAVCAVLILLMSEIEVPVTPQEDEIVNLTNDPVVRQFARLLVPVILMTGVYVVLNGHLSPGGGFSGGAIMGAGLMLYSMAYGFERMERFLNKKSFRLITLAALCFYSCSKCYSFYMGAHHLETGIPLGTPGAILSSGLILPLNIAVGIVVACTMYGFYSLFKRGRI